MVGDNSGRPDTTDVDVEARDAWIGAIQCALKLDAEDYQVAGVLRNIDADLNKDPEMYTAVLDRLVELKIVSKLVWREYLKVMPPEERVPL